MVKVNKLLTKPARPQNPRTQYSIELQEGLNHRSQRWGMAKSTKALHSLPLTLEPQRSFVQVPIHGPVLLLMGPIGLFFARFCRYLLTHGIPVTKISFPLYEFGFSANVKVPFEKNINEDWRPFLRKLIIERKIRYIFMYGDFILPHRIAIEEAQRAGIEAWVFELGYIRPNYVSLEKERVNARSNLNQPAEFYSSLPATNQLPRVHKTPSWRWRKIWKAPTFIRHAFTHYKIIEGEHKLQPSPKFLWYQIRGNLRFWIYSIQERTIKTELLAKYSYFLAILQVSSDSQIQLGSPYRGMHDFIEAVIKSFAITAHTSDHLAFKHHPRDRGYNHYGSLISLLSKRYGLDHRVHYFHDGELNRFIRSSRGIITINSTVGLQALFFGVPTKVMGDTFYNLPGLADQKPLEEFWQFPETSDRDLFYRFYNHMITTTQVNGNFDGEFPFSQTFPIGTQSNTVSPALAVSGTPLRGCFRRLTLVPRGGARLCWAAAFFVIYSLQLLALALRRTRAASSLLVCTAAAGLRALGVQVLLDDSQPAEPEGLPLVHIYNHTSPIDVLVIQAVIKLPSITTANLHMSHFMPWFAESAANAGHALMNHKDRQSRTAALYTASRTLAQQGQVILAPNGSLVTSIQERVSASPLLLARRHGALIVPWTFLQEGLPSPQSLRYRPLRFLLSRLTAPLGTIYCRRGRSQDLPQTNDRTDVRRFKAAVQAYYARSERSS